MVVTNYKGTKIIAKTAKRAVEIVMELQKLKDDIPKPVKIISTPLGKLNIFEEAKQ